jgi:AraC family transcriptional regulator
MVCIRAFSDELLNVQKKAVRGLELESMNTENKSLIILVGAEDPLPARHFWFEGADYAIYAAEQPRSAWREHSHECAQITIGLEPAHVHATWRTSKKTDNSRELSGNMVSIIRPGEPHRTLWQRRASLVHVYLGTSFLQAVADRLRMTSWELHSAYLVRDPFIEELGRVLYRECDAQSLNEEFTDSVMTVLATHLLRAYNTEQSLYPDFRGGLGPARERRVREYIEKSLDKDLSIRVLAEVAGISPRYFAVLFRQSTGFTPHLYVTRRRVERAQQLLLEGKLPLVEVAFQCGFTSQGQFSTLFRRFVGVSPGRFRASSSGQPRSADATRRSSTPAG